MLRSIVAIWSLAFTLIFVAVFAGCDAPAAPPAPAPAMHGAVGDFGLTPGRAHRLDAPPVSRLASLA